MNVIDKPEFCDFSFGAIVNRSPLVIGISTDGAAPVFGQAIRAKLEALIPRGFARWAEAARRWRREVKASGLSFSDRRRFWQIFTAHAVGNPDHEPEAADYDRLLTAARADSESADKGSVTLVGAGPGDPELLTLRAVRALQSADVILFDDLVSPEILDFARREAKKMHGRQDRPWPLLQAGRDQRADGRARQARPARGAAQGRRPDDLRPRRRGDRGLPQGRYRRSRSCPASPPRRAPQQALRLADAARGGAARAIRHRPRRRRQAAGRHRLASLADPAATTIVYMPKKTLGELAARAITAGLDPATPAVAVARATRPDEARIVSTIAELPERLVGAELNGPVVVMIGQTFASLVSANLNANSIATSIRPIEITAPTLAPAPHASMPTLQSFSGRARRIADLAGAQELMVNLQRRAGCWKRSPEVTPTETTCEVSWQRGSVVVLPRCPQLSSRRRPLSVRRATTLESRGNSRVWRQFGGSLGHRHG